MPSDPENHYWPSARHRKGLRAGCLAPGVCTTCRDSDRMKIGAPRGPSCAFLYLVQGAGYMNVFSLLHRVDFIIQVHTGWVCACTSAGTHIVSAVRLAAGGARGLPAFILPELFPRFLRQCPAQRCPVLQPAPPTCSVLPLEGNSVCLVS